jgi:CRP-like cAMP-binding protein
MSTGRRREVPDGHVIFSQGDAADGMYVILGGKVRIYREQDGNETTLAILKPGEFFGEMSIFDKKPRSASAQAVGDAELKIIDPSEFARMVSDPIVWSILEKMSSRIRETDEALEKLSVQDTIRREHLATLPLRSNPYL